MKISKTKAVALFVALGLKNADKWNDARIAAKLAKVKEMVDEDVKLEDSEAATLAEVTAANEAGEEFEVIDDDPAPDAPAEQAEGEPKAEKATKPKKTDEEKAAEKAAKEKEKADKAAEKARLKAEKEAAAKASKEPKVTRPGICGEVLKAKGLSLTTDVKIDEALAATVDELYGKVNPNESLFALRNAKNAILGYLATAEEAAAPVTE